MNSIYLASLTISFFRKKTKLNNRKSWVKWRDMVQAINSSRHKFSENKQQINQGVGDVRKVKSIKDLENFCGELKGGGLTDYVNYVTLFIEIEALNKDVLNEKKHREEFDILLEIIGAKADDALVESWLEKDKEDRFVTKIDIKGTLNVLWLDFVLRWLLLANFKSGDFLFKNFLSIPNENGIFILWNIVFIPLLVFLAAVFRDRYVKAKTTALFEELNIDNIELNTKHSPWHYLTGFVFLLTSTVIPVIATNEFDGDGALFMEGLFALFYGVYLLVILVFFSKTRPSVSEVKEQLDDLTFRQVKSDLNSDENDEEIIELEVHLRSSNEKMEAYVLEAALFGALAFSAFLQVVSSEVLSLANIESFSRDIFDVFQHIINFNYNEWMLILNKILSKEGLLSLMAYETLFCSVFFLAVIASRLRFNDITDSIDRFLNLAKIYNEKEEVLINAKEDKRKIEKVTREIRKLLSIGNLELKKTQPIMEYMRFFRTLGISSFFAIIVTGGLFISAKLSLVLLFISLLSLLYFKIGGIITSFKNVSTRIQEIYFMVGTKVYAFCWSIIGLGVVLRTINLTSIGAFLVVLGFLLLFLHYMISLFDHEDLEGAENYDDGVFNDGLTIIILSKKMYKVSLAFFFLGFMFKAMHWPGAGFLLIVGTFLMMIYFVIAPKVKGDLIWLSVVLTGGLVFSMLGILTKMMSWPGADMMEWLALISVSISIGLVWKYKDEVLVSIQKAIVFIFLFGFFAQVPFLRSGMISFDFNYNRYAEKVERRKIIDRITRDKENGGFSDATTISEIDSLRFYTNAAANNLKDYPDADILNEMAWVIYQNSSDSIVLSDAITISEESLRLDRNWMSLDTYAKLLYKIGQYGKAKKIALEVLEILKERKESTKDIEKLLSDIESKN